MIALAYLLILAFPPLSLLYAGIGLSCNPKRWRKYLPFLIYFVFTLICALTLKETGNKDLIRYYEYMDQARSLTFSEALNFRGDGLYVMNILYWFFGHLGYHQLLPAFAISIVIFSLSYITCDYAESQKAWEQIKYILLFQLMLLPFMYVMETVRSGMAFSLIVLMAYLEIVKRKRNVFIYLIYAAAIFIHNFAFLLILVRLARNEILGLD